MSFPPIVQTMSKPNPMPVILVSAKTVYAASRLISEIMEDIKKGVVKEHYGEREWVINNKYYKAWAILRPVGDDDTKLGDNIEAHVVLLDVGEGVKEGKRRVARAPPVEVALVAVEAPRISHDIAAWAAAARIEPVAMQAYLNNPLLPEHRPPFGCEHGACRLQEALHAHIWPGHIRHRPMSPPTQLQLLCDHCDEEPAVEEPTAEVELERFSAAAAALDAAARLSPSERRAQADSVMVTLARALRVPLDEL